MRNRNEVIYLFTAVLFCKFDEEMPQDTAMFKFTFFVFFEELLKNWRKIDLLLVDWQSNNTSTTEFHNSAI